MRYSFTGGPSSKGADFGGSRGAGGGGGLKQYSVINLKMRLQGLKGQSRNINSRKRGIQGWVDAGRRNSGEEGVG